VKESKLAKEQWLDLLMEKIKKGIKLFFEKFLEESIRNNEELVIMRNNKAVLVPAREIKIKK
jgi:hypothetical protein